MAPLDPVLDVTILLETFDDDRASVAELLDEARRFARSSRLEIDGAAAAGDAAAVVRAAHDLKGTAANVGAHEVASASSTCEFAAKARDLAAVRAALAGLDAAIERMSAVVDAFASTVG